MKTKHFPILIELDEDGVYIVSCPQFKGCHSYGETIQEALDNIKEAIELNLENEVDVVGEVNTFIGFREIEVIQNA